jgi:hypothetical protein
MQSSGPWLILNTEDGTWLISMEGDEIGLIPAPSEYFINTLEVAPQGGLVAMLMDNMSERILEVISVQTYETLLKINLSDYKGEGFHFEDELQAEQYKYDRHFALGQPKWSSDGNFLAFVSSHLGPSPDVYVYDLKTGKVSQLTSGPTHAVNLHWSPDNRHIFHAGVSNLFVGSSGAGYSNWVFYSVTPEGKKVIKVYEGLEERGYEQVVGWYTDESILMESGYWWCGYFDFRLVNIESGKRVSIWQNKYDLITYNPIDKIALVWVSPEATSSEHCGLSGESGLFLVSLPSGQRNKVEGFEDSYMISSLDWVVGTSKFIADLRTLWSLIDINGEVEYLLEQPIYSPDKKTIALLGYEGESLRLVDQAGNNIEVDIIGNILYPTWSPDGEFLYYFSENESGNLYDLYVVQTPDFKPVLVQKELFSRYDPAPVWMMP